MLDTLYTQLMGTVTTLGKWETCSQYFSINLYTKIFSCHYTMVVMLAYYLS